MINKLKDCKLNGYCDKIVSALKRNVNLECYGSTINEDYFHYNLYAGNKEGINIIKKNPSLKYISIRKYLIK